MKLDISYLHESVTPEEVGGFVHTALADDKAPFVYISRAIPPVHREPEKAKQYVTRLLRPIGSLAFTNKQSITSLEEITADDIGPSYHTDHPYIEQPARFIGLFALDTSSWGAHMHLLNSQDFLAWAADHPEHSKVVREMRSNGITFRRGQERAQRIVLGASTSTFRFNTSYLSTKSSEWGQEVARVLRQADEVAQQVTLHSGDALFFDNHMQLHRLTRPTVTQKDGRPTFLRTHIRGESAFRSTPKPRL